MNPNVKWLLAGVLGILLVLMYMQKNSNEYDYGKRLKEGAVILSFGDSLTYGFGTSTQYSYPAILEKLSGFRVVNAGVNGELSSEGLHRLPTLLTQKPDLVILCHGGNDIIQRVSNEDLKTNLLSMIDMIQAGGAEVLLVGIPDFGLLGFDTHEVYYEVAKLKNVILEDRALEYIEARRNLKSDYIHPNKEGYKIMAEHIYEILKKYNFFK